VLLTDPGEVNGPVRQTEWLLLLFLLQSSTLLFVVFLRVLGSLMERRDVTDCVTHLVHARSFTTVPHGRSSYLGTFRQLTLVRKRSCLRSVPHGKPEPWPLFHMVEPPGLSDFQRFEAPLCAPESSMALLFGLACQPHHAPQVISTSVPLL